MQSINTTCEEWRPVPDYFGYEVSNLGRVRSYRSRNGRGELQTHPHFLKLCPTPKKLYLRVGFSCEDHVAWFPVHTLVLLVFVGPKPTSAHECCHGDGNPKRNHLSNLRWDTPQANANDRILHGTQLRGEQIGISVLTEDQVREIKAAIPTWKKGMGKFFAQKFGVGNNTISAIKHNKTWCHI